MTIDWEALPKQIRGLEALTERLERSAEGTTVVVVWM